MKRFFILIFSIILLIGVVFVLIKFTKIKDIICESQYGDCNSNLKSEILNIKKDNIFNTRSNLINTLTKDKSVMNFAVRFLPPFDFKVDVIEKKAIVAFILKDGSFALVDEDGDIIGNVTKTALPKISSSFNLDKNGLMFISNLMSSLYTFYGMNSGILTRDGLEVDGIQGKEVIFPLSGDRDILLGSLSLILSRLPSVKEASTIETIDLRFKNPVLK